MPYMIELECSYTHDMQGRRVPKKETRATLASAINRAKEMMRRLGAREFNEIPRPYGVYLDAGRYWGAHVYDARLGPRD